jgi:hypothetical protein
VELRLERRDRDKFLGHRKALQSMMLGALPWQFHLAAQRTPPG